MFQIIAEAVEAAQEIALILEESQISAEIIQEMQALMQEMPEAAEVDADAMSEIPETLEAKIPEPDISNQQLESRETYIKNGHSYETDDCGKIYKQDGELIPGVEYSDNGGKFSVDDKGNIESLDESGKVEGYNTETDIESSISEYLDDIKSKSEYPETIKSETFERATIEKQSPEKVAEMREDFDDNKAKLRKEWEVLNNKEWPRYKESVYNDKGVMVRKAGDCYDAHHIQPLSMGGKNEASNITPLDLKSHAELHSSNGSCNMLIERFGIGGK